MWRELCISVSMCACMYAFLWCKALIRVLCTGISNVICVALRVCRSVCAFSCMPDFVLILDFNRDTCSYSVLTE